MNEGPIQDEEMRRLERQALVDPAAEERLRARERRFLSGYDADYLLRYLRLCDEVVGTPGYHSASMFRRLGHAGAIRSDVGTSVVDDYFKNVQSPVIEPRERSVVDLERALEELNREFEGKLSHPRLLRRTLSTLDALREGAEIGAWSASTLGCMPSEDYGNDPNLPGYVGDQNDKHDQGPWTRLVLQADVLEGFREAHQKEGKCYYISDTDPRPCLRVLGHADECQRDPRALLCSKGAPSGGSCTRLANHEGGCS